MSQISCKKLKKLLKTKSLTFIYFYKTKNVLNYYLNKKMLLLKSLKYEIG
jgi:hypothetical protein